MFGFHAAPAEHYELHHSGQLCETMPCREAGKVVVTDEVEELPGRVAVKECFSCVDGVGRGRTMEIHRIAFETGLGLKCRAQHFKTNLRDRESLMQFVGRSGGRNKKHLVKKQRFPRFTRQNQMTVMNRIEGAAEDADFAHGNVGDVCKVTL
jgi:hypothetical protein